MQKQKAATSLFLNPSSEFTVRPIVFFMNSLHAQNPVAICKVSASFYIQDFQCSVLKDVEKY